MPLTSLRCPGARTLCPLEMERLSWRRIPIAGHVIFAPFVSLSEAELGPKPYRVRYCDAETLCKGHHRLRLQARRRRWLRDFVLPPERVRSAMPSSNNGLLASLRPTTLICWSRTSNPCEARAAKNPKDPTGESTRLFPVGRPRMSTTSIRQPSALRK